MKLLLLLSCFLTLSFAQAAEPQKCPACCKCELNCLCGCKITGICNCPIPKKTCQCGPSCSCNCGCKETGECSCPKENCPCGCGCCK